jgi:hypothetical protein
MAEILSQAHYLFEKFTAPNAATLLMGLPNTPEKTFESDWLDFKRGRVQDKDIPRIWSKIVGAFANNEGGVVVWGIIAEKDATTNIDAVQTLDLVADVNALKSRLMELRHQAVDPPIANIEIVGLPLKAGSPEGFVICLIPESGSKPHRSEHADKKFYIRMGDASRECSVSLLRQLFYPKRNPRIEATIKSIRRPNVRLALTPVAANQNHVRFAFEIGVSNISEISIDDVQTQIKCDGYKLFSFSWNNIQQKYDVEFLPNVISFKTSIHPKISQSMYILLASESLNDPRDITIGVFARDMPPRKAVLPFVTKEGDTASVECLP